MLVDTHRVVNMEQACHFHVQNVLISVRRQQPKAETSKKVGSDKRVSVSSSTILVCPHSPPPPRPLLPFILIGVVSSYPYTQNPKIATSVSTLPFPRPLEQNNAAPSNYYRRKNNYCFPCKCDSFQYVTQTSK